MSIQPEYRRLGTSGLRVSVPILGTMGMGDLEWNNWVLPEDKSIALLKAAWDAGITTLDTANMYSNGVSESIIGKFLKEYEIPREHMIIITKLRFLVDHEQMSNITAKPSMRPGMANLRDYVNQGGLSRAAIFNQAQASLERLQIDYVDILMIHMTDLATPFEETMCALNDLVRSGKARYLGASNVRAWHLIEMNNIAERNGWTKFSCIQVEHSLLYRAEELELIAYCHYKGIGVTAYAPLMDGHLARPIGTETTRSKKYSSIKAEKPRLESDLKIIQRVQELSEKKNWKMSQVALAWLLSKNSIPIVGANSTERLYEAIVVGKTLTNEEIKYLEELYEHRPVRF
ncbi:Aldo/keto reductase [Lentinula aff. detonsa]|uniref:Aldo/keto reductase n=1 Tax=Lentinula aff. detonsa TaxID=2804958 RepID=A0AA38L4M5_9AGAR|nr:Aldo/keto reductase [Lentinula aff. detonsa]